MANHIVGTEYSKPCTFLATKWRREGSLPVLRQRPTPSHHHLKLSGQAQRARGCVIRITVAGYRLRHNRPEVVEA